MNMGPPADPYWFYNYPGPTCAESMGSVPGPLPSPLSYQHSPPYHWDPQCSPMMAMPSSAAPMECEFPSGYPTFAYTYEGLYTDPQQDARLRRRREQNKQAAQRCRQKRREQEDQLVDELRGLEGENSSLAGSIFKLQKEKAELEAALHKHVGGCTKQLRTQVKSPGRGSPYSNQTSPRQIPQQHQTGSDSPSPGASPHQRLSPLQQHWMAMERSPQPLDSPSPQQQQQQQQQPHHSSPSHQMSCLPPRPLPQQQQFGIHHQPSPPQQLHSPQQQQQLTQQHTIQQQSSPPHPLHHPSALPPHLSPPHQLHQSRLHPHPSPPHPSPWEPVTTAQLQPTHHQPLHHQYPQHHYLRPHQQHPHLQTAHLHPSQQHRMPYQYQHQQQQDSEVYELL